MIKSLERKIMVQKQKVSQTSFLKKVKFNKLKCNFIKKIIAVLKLGFN
jgi:uncharacterized membrane protein YqhA